MKYELNNNAATLSDEQKQKIESDIRDLENIVKKSSEDKHGFARFIQDKLGLVADKDVMSHETITDEMLFDFEEKIFGDKH